MHAGGARYDGVEEGRKGGMMGVMGVNGGERWVGVAMERGRRGKKGKGNGRGRQEQTSKREDINT